MAVVTPTLVNANADFDPAWSVLSIDVVREVDRIPRAHVVLRDGDAAQRAFAVSDTAFFEPGQEIEIKLRYEDVGTDTTVFKGLVVKHSVEAAVDGSLLAVELKDAAVKLTGVRKSAVHVEMSDDKIISELISAAGLTAGTIAATKPVHAELVQYYCTDWDFLLARAEAQGLLVAVTDGEVALTAPEIKGSPKHVFQWGISQIFDFELAADAGHQFGAVESVAWSLADQKLTAPSAAAAVTLVPGNLDGATMAEAIGFDTCTLSHPVPVEADELQAWADGKMIRSRLAMLRGRLGMPGLAEIVLLDEIELEGIGKRFDGPSFVTGVRHHVAGGEWRTDVQFGLSPERFTRRTDIAEAPAAGLLPPVSGLQIGVVSAFEDDPAKELRFRVVLPAVDETAAGAVWARLATLDAGAGRGIVFRPEVGDEVVVGFLNNDPRHPVILGSLYSSKNTPPDDLATPDADNNLRVIASTLR